MKRKPVPLRRILRPTALFVLPALVVLLVCAAIGAMTPAAAIAAGLATAAGTAFVAGLLIADLDAIRQYITDTARDTRPSRPSLVFRDLLYGVMSALLRARTGPLATRPEMGEMAGLDRLPDPVVMLDAARRIVRTNAPARNLLGLDPVGRDLAALIRNPVLLQAVDTVLGGTDAAAEVEFSVPVPVERHFAARIVRCGSVDPQGIAIVIALHDVTMMRRSEEMRSDFIANASHELRTPISVLLGCVQTLRGSARDDPEAQAEFFGLMESQAERMARLVDDLLALSRIELNEHTLPSDEIDLGELLEQTRDTLSLKAVAQGMRIAIDVPRDIGRVVGDREDLTRVFQNLIDNAIKYGANGTEVVVRARVAGRALPPPLTGRNDYVAIAVADKGEGIAPEHLPRLTERFYRTDTVLSRRLGGTGLGLAIVKHAVNRHRGALSIESTPGNGSTFTVYLPAVRKRLAPPDAGENGGETPDVQG